jgi:hypothetical protein
MVPFEASTCVALPTLLLFAVEGPLSESEPSPTFVCHENMRLSQSRVRVPEKNLKRGSKKAGCSFAVYDRRTMRQESMRWKHRGVCLAGIAVACCLVALAQNGGTTQVCNVCACKAPK